LTLQVDIYPGYTIAWFCWGLNCASTAWRSDPCIVRFTISSIPPPCPTDHPAFSHLFLWAGSNQEKL